MPDEVRANVIGKVEELLPRVRRQRACVLLAAAILRLVLVRWLMGAASQPLRSGGDEIGAILLLAVDEDSRTFIIGTGGDRVEIELVRDAIRRAAGDDEDGTH